MGAKQTAQLIPLCHNIPLDKVSVELRLDSSQQCVHIEAMAKTQAYTGAVLRHFCLYVLYTTHSNPHSATTSSYISLQMMVWKGRQVAKVGTTIAT